MNYLLLYIFCQNNAPRIILCGINRRQREIYGWKNKNRQKLRNIWIWKAVPLILFVPEMLHFHIWVQHMFQPWENTSCQICTLTRLKPVISLKKCANITEKTRVCCWSTLKKEVVTNCSLPVLVCANTEWNMMQPWKIIFLLWCKPHQHYKHSYKIDHISLVRRVHRYSDQFSVLNSWL